MTWKTGPATANVGKGRILSGTGCGVEVAGSAKDVGLGVDDG